MTTPGARDPWPTPVTRRRPSSRRPTTTRTFPAASSIPATPGLAKPFETGADGAPARLERLGEPSRVLASAGGAVRGTATAAADDRRDDVLHDVPGVDLRREVLAHRQGDRRPARVRRAEHRDARSQAVAHAIGEAAEVLLVHVADVRKHETRAVELLGARDERGRGRVDAA